MAGVAYYNTGTATATVGSKTVTGTGTNWLSTVGGLTAIKAGDKFGIHVGRPIIIASVDSNTQLTLEDNWPGPAQTNAAYRIELTSPDVIAVEALRRMLGSLSSGVLYGLSQLPSTPSKALTIDENGSAALADMGATGKSLLASLNSSAAYGVLGEIPNAQLPTRLRELSAAVTDADTVLANGSYAVTSSTLNIPEAAPGILEVGMYSGTTAGVQTYTRAATGAPNRWMRVRNSSAWGAWMRIPNFGTDNIIPDASLPPQISQFPGTATRPTDADDFRRFGVVQVISTTLNIPVATAGVLLNVPYDNGTLRQIFWPNNDNRAAYHRRRAGTWQPWTRFDGDLSGPGGTVGDGAIAGFNGTSGYSIKALTQTEALGKLGPVLGGVAPEPAAAGVGMANGDFDTVIFPGVYTIAGSWANGPNGATASTYVGILEVQARSYNNLYVQILRLNNGVVHKRYGSSGPAWNAWGITEGDVSGPAVSVDGAFVQSSGTTGKVLKAASIATATILGRSSSGAGAVEQLTAAQARSVMSVPSVAEMNALVTTARQVRLGAEASISATASAWNKAANSAVLTGMYLGSGFTVGNISYRTVQQTDLSGNWVAVAQV
ncbi:pyocin knob domain-containing protein [Agrobacterium tumefaciens]|uniref:pyocin knob domain-containing protein n=1 Tax=Agrobacterium tumefaciens TaxID=358 RepID=UPI001573C993|nr:pyocin knob domain-containing protein [Agrobacterium tumefaciens]